MIELNLDVTFLKFILLTNWVELTINRLLSMEFRNLVLHNKHLGLILILIQLWTPFVRGSENWKKKKKLSSKEFVATLQVIQCQILAQNVTFIQSTSLLALY